MPQKQPIGSRWRAEDGRGGVAEIWLEARHANGREVWKWSFVSPAFRTPQGDWTPSYRKCREEIAILLHPVQIVFKRVED
jgi:hypothetical protein